MSELLAAALDYAARCLPVFPCVPRGKTPAIARGFHAATTNPATIRRLWTDPDRNIGIPTGASSRLWILDIDGEEGEASLRDLEARHGAIPKTRIVITSRGRHAWFAYAGTIPSSVGKIGPGLDVRADGGYAIAPPSVHSSGHCYAFRGDPWQELAAAPQWLIDAARARPECTITERAVAMIRPPCDAGAYGNAALRTEIATLVATPPGFRNQALNRAAFNLFQLVAGGELSEDEVTEALQQACEVNGLARDDGWGSVRATIRSGRRAGMQYPRSRGTP
jgi:bifunctional DNA primase/polymerase-like protein